MCICRMMHLQKFRGVSGLQRSKFGGTSQNFNRISQQNWPKTKALDEHIPMVYGIREQMIIGRVIGERVPF